MDLVVSVKIRGVPSFTLGKKCIIGILLFALLGGFVFAFLMIELMLKILH